MLRFLPTISAAACAAAPASWLRAGVFVLAASCMGASAGAAPAASAASATPAAKTASASAPASVQQPVSGAIAQRVAACAACHGDEGRATADGYYPRIAGKPEGYLYNQLLNFREGRRKYAAMSYMVDALPDAYLREIAQYFSAQHPPYAERAPEPQPPSAAQLERGRVLVSAGDAGRGLPACMACHGGKLLGLAPAVPGLIGLPKDYLLGQLGAWKNGTRRALAPDCMAQIADKLNGEDVAAVAAWLAAQPTPDKKAAAAPAVDAAINPKKLPLRCGSMP
ncbi:MAG: c-type cytochrome [Candidatus Protistobacter heckmanni]|nr:c-type cytochrome [Candidatus Protistobacter heckmanni]